MSAIADGYHISDLIEIIIGIDAVRGKRGLGIIQLTVASGQMETLGVMEQMPLSHMVHSLIINHHINVNINVQLILPTLDRTLDLLALPGKPIGDMGIG